MDANLLSIVIPCKNEEKYIRRTLNALKVQSIMSRDIPIFIADAGSTDHTVQIIEEYKKDLNIQIVPGGLPAAGRNKGASYCTTKYILFLDADIILGERLTLERVLTMAEKQDLDLVTTGIKSTENTWHDNVLWNLHTFASKTKWLGAYATGMFIFMKREEFIKRGGFNEEIILGEDWDLTHQISAEKFSFCDTYIYTTNRRFVSTGYLKTIWQYIMVACSKRYRQKKHSDYFNVQYN